MKTTRVAVLRGGPSEEYEVSMETGKSVLAALEKLQYPTKDIMISRSGEWLIDGVARQPERALEAIDVVFIALHGNYGEDGTVQKILERHHIPFTGSRAFASGFALNKDLTKNLMRQYEIAMPKHMKLSRSGVSDPYRSATALQELLGHQVVIKPLASGSSLGVQIITEAPELPLALTNALTDYDEIIVEEYIHGKEATVGVLEGFRGAALYRLPAIEIVPPATEQFFSYNAKYSGDSDEICPGRFSEEEKHVLGEIASLVHDRLGLAQYSRSDFIIKDGRPYFLEVNTLPGLTAQSLFPKTVSAVGASYEDLIEHLITTAKV
ncbi:MAG: D-alanine--D-alanine ligase [Patescibacteria group bacterium]